MYRCAECDALVIVTESVVLRTCGHSKSTIVAEIRVQVTAGGKLSA